MPEPVWSKSWTCTTVFPPRHLYDSLPAKAHRPAVDALCNILHIHEADHEEFSQGFIIGINLSQANS